MKTRKVETITSNEDHVRLQIFAGDLQISEAAAELIRLAQAQLAAECSRHRVTKERLAALYTQQGTPSNG